MWEFKCHGGVEIDPVVSPLNPQLGQLGRGRIGRMGNIHGAS
jgi:hypothetical protein